MQNLLKCTKFTRVMNAVAAGTTDQNGSVIDMAGYDNVVFGVSFGTITSGAATTIKVQQGTDSGGSDMADLAGSKVTVADTDDNKLALVEVYRPQERYVRVVVTRATQNSVIDSAWAIQTSPRVNPPTQDSTTVITPTFVNSPAEGTA